MEDLNNTDKTSESAEKELRVSDVIESVCERCGEEKEINGVSGYCDDCRPKNR